MQPFASTWLSLHFNYLSAILFTLCFGFLCLNTHATLFTRCKEGRTQHKLLFAVFFAIIYPLLTIFLTCYTFFLCVSWVFFRSTCTRPDPSLIPLLFPPSNIRFTSTLALWRSFNPSSSGSAAIKAAPVTPLPAIDPCCRGRGAAFAQRSRPFRTVCAQQRGHSKAESSKGSSRDASIPVCVIKGHFTD